MLGHQELLSQDWVPKPDWAWNLSKSNNSYQFFTWTAHCKNLSQIWFINETWFYAINYHGKLSDLRKLFFISSFCYTSKSLTLLIDSVLLSVDVRPNKGTHTFKKAKRRI